MISFKSYDVIKLYTYWFYNSALLAAYYFV